MTDLELYFLQPRAERILLIEITRADGKVYYLSDTNYLTEPSDALVSMPFSPVISQGGLPRIKRTLTDPLEGSVQTSYGDITLATAAAVYRTSADARGYEDLSVFRGNQIVVKLAGPRSTFAYATALTLFTGRVGRVTRNSEGEVTIEMVDPVDQVRSNLVPMTTYSGGGFKPRLFGKCYNVTPVLTDRATLVYQVNDGQVQSIAQVYDNGVPVAYTPDAANGKFTLTSAPAGVVTADVEGDAPSGVWKNTTQEIIERLLDLCGLTSGVLPRFFSGVPVGTVGYYMTKPEELHEVVTKLVRGAGCWWSTNRDGVFTVRAMPYPGGAALDFDGIDDDVLVPIASPATTSEGSVEFWIELPGSLPGAVQGVIADYDGAAGEDGGWLVELQTNGNLNWRGNTIWDLDLATPLAATGAYHVVYTADNAGFAKVYVNGVFSAQVANTYGFRLQDLKIGRYAHAASNYFEGKLDGVRIYSRELTADEVADHYAGVFDDDTGLQLQTGFDEGSGLVAYDTSGNGRNGTISGAAHVAAVFYEGVAYDAKTMLKPGATYRTEDRVIREVRARYRPNWTRQTQFAASAATAQVEFAQGEGLFVTANGTGDESDPISINLETYFIDSADAVIPADRVLDLYENQRRLFAFSVSVGDQRLEPGSLVTVAEPVPGDLYVLSVEDVIDGLYPMQVVEAIG